MAITVHRSNQYVRFYYQLLNGKRLYSRISPPRAADPEPVIRVVNNVAHLGSPKVGPKPRQLLSLPPFPADPLPARCSTKCPNEMQLTRVTAISWVKYYFDEVHDSVIQSHFNKGLVQVESSIMDDSSSVTGKKSMRKVHNIENSRAEDSSSITGKKSTRKIKHNEVMKAGAKIHVPVSIAESRISRRFDPIPCGTLYPNADEIAYLQRLVMYKDSAIIVLNKPPKLPVKGNLPVHNSMDALAAAALSYDFEEGPQLVHRLDRESSGILLMGRTKESTSYLQQLFTDMNVAKTSCLAWNDACETTFMRHWALIIGSPREKEGVICARLTKVLLDDGKTERVMLAHPSGVEASQEAMTEYRVLGPMINGCSWIELRPLTSRKHQLRVHCAEALGTPIVGDYKYGWFVHRKWKQTPQSNIEPTSGEPYKLRQPHDLDIQKGSVLSKVPLLHLHCRELVLPNIAKFLGVLGQRSAEYHPKLSDKPDALRFVASMPSHMKISWNVMSSYLV